MLMSAVTSLIFSTPALMWLTAIPGWSGWFSRSSLGDEGLVASDDHHDEQVGDHHHVDEPSTMT